MLQYVRLLLVIGFLGSIFGCQGPEHEHPSGPIDIDELLSQMTIEEKVGMIHASSSFTSGGVERLGIPELIMSDGPHGVRLEHGRDWAADENVYDSSTYLPVGTSLAATWNEELGYAYGSVLGSEANYRGKDVILGPGLNIIRSPLNGRNFEYLSEDPLLNSKMVVGYIQGVQDQDVAVCAKHYIANTLEYDRERVNVILSDRALREIYLPGYIACIEAGAYTFMAAYNKVNGVYCAHSQYLLDTLLKDELGFQGAVISDWNAVKSTMEAVPAGIDIEMGTDLTMPADDRDYSKFHMGDTVVSLVKNGVFDESVIDKKVSRILWVMEKIGKFRERKKGSYNTPEHQEVARKIADEAIVLLQNDGILPLEKSETTKIAVIGANAKRRHAGGGGSSQVKAFYEVTPWQGLENLLGSDVDLSYTEGYTISREGGSTPQMIQAAVSEAEDADVVIYVGGFIHGYTDAWDDNAYDAEVVDKPDMFLPFNQEELLNAVLDANKNTVVVLFSGGPVDMRSWQTKAAAIVHMFYPGMEGGNALADIIFGNVNPSAKLPMTFPVKLEDSPAHSLASYPDENLTIDHKEGIFVGYRYFDSYNLKPAFPFGHGLSYTSFEFDDLDITQDGNIVSASLDITNTGDQAGAEVVQVYVSDLEASSPRPDQELKGFKKVFLQPGESQSITFELEQDAFKFYDEDKQTWVLEAGTFEVRVGSSSRDIRLHEIFEW